LVKLAGVVEEVAPSVVVVVAVAEVPVVAAGLKILSG
jgi:hypothetical protein